MNIKLTVVSDTARDWNANEELRQRAAWRIVRAAADKLGAEKGAEKRVWAIEQMSREFPNLAAGFSELYIRAAYVNFKMEATWTK